MGGYGSGRRGYRPVVEEGLKLSIYYFQRERLLERFGGTIYWSSSRTKEITSSIGYSVDQATKEVTLSYTRTVRGEPRHIEDSIQVSKTSAHFGGDRYWWVCPGCYRRCAMLYLPRGELSFRCRSCYNLTYRSSNEGKRFDALFLAMATELGVSMKDVKRGLGKL